MHLRPIDGESDLELAASWLSRPEVHEWLHFGPGVQAPGIVALRVMAQRDAHRIRLFASGPGGDALGLVALSDIDLEFRTATLWYALGEGRLAGRGLTSRAVGLLLEEAFCELGLASVGAWVVEGNAGSVRVLERNGFRPMGRRRLCHRVGGALRDRLLYDLLAHEHERGRAGARRVGTDTERATESTRR